MWQQMQKNIKKEETERKEGDKLTKKPDVPIPNHKLNREPVNPREQKINENESKKEGNQESKQERVGGIYDEILNKAKEKKRGKIIHSEIEGDAKQVMDSESVEKQVDKLVKLAQTKGVVHAVKVAQHMNNYFILDRVHDEMALGKMMYQTFENNDLIEKNK